VDLEVVDEPGRQGLVDRVGAAGDVDVLPPGRVRRPLDRGLDSVGHEVEGRAALHLKGLRGW
jgi:hypothetical protein